MLLVDTSVWVIALSRAPDIDLPSLLDIDDVATCAPVIQEVLQGIREPRAHEAVRVAMMAMPCIGDPMPRTLFLAASDLYRQARRVGLTVRSPTDCLIAACALSAQATVLHRDRDFAALARVAPLEAREV